MREPTFERYKEVLKAGHVAVLQGRLDEALERYGEAATIADERALPHASMGSVLLRMGRVDDALAAYAKALGRAPRDEAALNGRAEALLAADRRPEAAEVLERLAEVQVAGGRVPEAERTIRRALRLQATKDRERRAQELAALVAAGADTELEDQAATDGLIEGEAAEALAIDSGERTVATGAAGDGAAVAGLAPPDPESFLADADGARDAGRAREALALYVLASDGYARRGAPEAALEACQRALEVGPEAPAVHLALARLYLARGWHERAVEKLELVDRFLGLEPAPAARRELAALAALHAAGDERLVAIARSPDGGSLPAA